MRSPAIRATTVDHDSWWALTLNGVLNVYGDLTQDDGGRIGRHSRIERVQLAQDFTVSSPTWQVLEEDVFRRLPGATLRYGWLARDRGRVDIRPPSQHGQSGTMRACMR